MLVLSRMRGESVVIGPYDEIADAIERLIALSDPVTFTDISSWRQNLVKVVEILRTPTIIDLIDIRGDKVKLGFRAARELSIHRKEVYDKIKQKAKED